MKRVLSIQDISCVGRCSLTVALPILSAMGVEACPLPTALLSTHTAFKHFTFKDLTDEMEPIDQVWEQEGLTFDVAASGYLGSIRQIEIVRKIGQRLRCAYEQTTIEDAENGSCEVLHPDRIQCDAHSRTETYGDAENDTEGTVSHVKSRFLQIVDPAMADHGKLYTGFTREFVEAMAQLCREADLILPNLTEACLMTGIEYRPDGDEGYWQTVVDALADMGCRGVILTGYSPDDHSIGAYSMQVQGSHRVYKSYTNERLAGSFHGTGDIFASVVTGAMTRDTGLETAIKLAVDFTLECMRKTRADPNHRPYGVNFEQALPMLTEWQTSQSTPSLRRASAQASLSQKYS